MTDAPRKLSDLEEVADIVATAGGEFVGRTRLQKTAYLLEVTGLGASFGFEYKHYGPYSDELAETISFAVLIDELEEEEKKANWGGIYSVYRSSAAAVDPKSSPRSRLINLAARSNPIELELAATAVFLALEGYDNPWGETAERKPDKANNNRLAGAKKLYADFRSIEMPKELPDI